jgi:putative endonuclease
MADSHELGLKGEDLAVEHLKKAGYKILNQNWVWGKNEIDIIAENDQFIVFVEVKTRKQDYHLHPMQAVTHSKQRSIIFAASGYIKKFAIDKESRFDIITVIETKDGYNVDHLTDAFYVTLH